MGPGAHLDVCREGKSLTSAGSGTLDHSACSLVSILSTLCPAACIVAYVCSAMRTEVASFSETVVNIHKNVGSHARRSSFLYNRSFIYYSVTVSSDRT